MTVSELCLTLKKAVDPIVESIIRIVANKAGAKAVSIFMLDGSFLKFYLNYLEIRKTLLSVVVNCSVSKVLECIYSIISN